MLERIGFLLEGEDHPYTALLNPDSIRMRRQSGLRTLGDRPGTIAGAGAADDTIIPTSGGRTEIEVDLLFDIDLVPTPENSDAEREADIRRITGRFWSLSENRSDAAGPPTCRLVWGKHLNVSVVVEAVAERVERFDAAGFPKRSYLSMRMLRAAEAEPADAPAVDASVPPVSTAQATPRAPVADDPGTTFHEVGGGAPVGEDAPHGERLDEIANRYYGNPAYWRHLAAVNAIDELPWVTPGRILVIPPVELLAAPPVEVADAEGGVSAVVEVAIDAVSGGATTAEVVATVEAGLDGEPAP